MFCSIYPEAGKNPATSSTSIQNVSFMVIKTISITEYTMILKAPLDSSTSLTFKFCKVGSV